MVLPVAKWNVRTGHRFTSSSDTLSVDLIARTNYVDVGSGGEGGIESVTFYVNGDVVSEQSATSRRRPNYNITINPNTGTTEMQDIEAYGFDLNAADYDNGTLAITAEVTSYAGSTTTLPTIKVYNNKDTDTRPSNKEIFVSPTGNDSNPGTELLPVASIQKAFELAAVSGNLAGATIILLPGAHVWSGYYFGLDTARYTSDHWWVTMIARPGATVSRPGAMTVNGEVSWSGGGSDTLFLIPDTGEGHEDTLRLLLIQEDPDNTFCTDGSLIVWTGGSTTTQLHVEGGKLSHAAYDQATNPWSVRFVERRLQLFSHIAGGGAGSGSIEATNLYVEGTDNAFLGYSYVVGCKASNWVGITFQTTTYAPSIFAANVTVAKQRYNHEVNGLIDCLINSGVNMVVLDTDNLRIQQSSSSDVNPLGDFGNPSTGIQLPDLSLYGAELSLSNMWGITVYDGTTPQSGVYGLEVVDSGSNGTGPYIDISWPSHGYGSDFSLAGWRLKTSNKLRDDGSGNPYNFVQAVHPDVWQAYAPASDTLFYGVRGEDCNATRIWSSSFGSGWTRVVLLNCGDGSLGNISDIQPPSMTDCLFHHCTFGATVDMGSISGSGVTEFRRCVFVDLNNPPTGITFDGNHFVDPGDAQGTNYTTGDWFDGDPEVDPFNLTPLSANQGQAIGKAIGYSSDYVFEDSEGNATAGVWLDVAEGTQLDPPAFGGGDEEPQVTINMATTTTALGTVPQLIVDAGTTVLTASFATLVEFDTHGAEFIGFQMQYTKGGETGVSLTVQAKLISDGSWVTLPILPTRAETSDTATTSRAFQLYVGREVNALRIQGKVTAGTDNSTKVLRVWGMLSAPTFPIIGTVI